MADTSPSTRLATAFKNAKGSHAKGLLLADGLSHWKSALEAAGLLSCTDFSKAEGAAEAASGSAFEPDLTKDDADRDKALDLCAIILEAADKSGCGRGSIPADRTPELIVEFRRVAACLAGQDASVKRILIGLNEKAAEDAGKGHLASPPPASGESHASFAPPPSRVAEAHASFAFQNNGEPLAAGMRPPDAMVESVITSLSGETKTLPDFEEVAGSLKGLMRHEVLTLLDQGLVAAVLATSGTIGQGWLTHLTAEPAIDKIAAEDDNRTGARRIVPGRGAEAPAAGGAEKPAVAGPEGAAAPNPGFGGRDALPNRDHRRGAIEMPGSGATAPAAAQLDILAAAGPEGAGAPLSEIPNRTLPPRASPLDARPPCMMAGAKNIFGPATNCCAGCD